MNDFDLVAESVRENIESITQDYIKHTPDDLLLDRIDLHCSEETNTLAYHVLAQIIKGNMIYPAMGTWQVTPSGERSIETLQKLVTQELSAVIEEEELERARRLYETLKARRHGDDSV